MGVGIWAKFVLKPAWHGPNNDGHAKNALTYCLCRLQKLAVAFLKGTFAAVKGILHMLICFLSAN